MISIVLWKWARPGYRTTFTAAHVNALAAMIARFYAFPHRVICVTDAAAGFAPGIEVLPPWDDFADVPSPHGGGNPSCYRRLRAWHPDAAQWFGERFVCLDLDSVIVDDLAPLWNRSEDFVAFRDPFWPNQYNGSMWLQRAGARPEVWTDFRPTSSPRVAAVHGFKGSDQAWLSFRAPGAPTWSQADGVHSFKFDVMRSGGELPKGARIVFFTGDPKPWSPAAQAIPWVREFYPLPAYAPTAA